VIAIMLARLPRLRWAYYALMPALALASLITWHGLPSAFAAAATMLSTIGRMQTNDAVLRVLLLASTPFWTAHDLFVGSLPGLIADLLSMATGAAMLLRRTPAVRRILTSAMEQVRRLAQRAGLFRQQLQTRCTRPAAGTMRSAQRPISRENTVLCK
jgi:Bacterial inner membrane protein